MDSFCIGTCNPNPSSWVYPIIKWYLDEEGTPDPEKVGVVRYYIVLDGEFVFGESEQYFIDNYPDAVNVHNPITKETIFIPPKTFTFIAGNIFDNPALIEANPRYLSELQNLPDHERLRQLWGNWHARPKGAFYFDRNWIKDTDRVPEGSVSVRGYDLAAREPSETYKHPDATTSIQYHKCPQGYFYITGNYHQDFYDEHQGHEIGGRLRKRIGTRNQVMMDQARLDGSDCINLVPVDPSSAGLQAYDDIAKQFAAIGARCKKDVMPTNKGKLTKFLPFADAAQNGLVFIVRDTFPNDETIEFIFKELEAFDGERSTAHRKDDFPDCIATSHNGIAKTTVTKPVVLPSIQSNTLLKTHRSRIR